MGLCDVKAHPGHLCLGKRLADLIKHEGVSPWGGVYIGVLRGSGADHWEVNIWKFMVHVLLKPGLENFEHYFASV